MSIARPRACGIPACETCDDGKCIECIAVERWSFFPPRGFHIDADGRCYLPFEVGLERTGEILLMAIIAILIFSIMANFFVVKVKGQRQKMNTMFPDLISSRGSKVAESVALLLGSDEEDAEVNAKKSSMSIAHGLNAWLQRQMRDPATPKFDRYKITANLSKEFIIGAGLPLFYGFQRLVGMSAVITAVVVGIAQYNTGLDDVLAKLEAMDKEDNPKLAESIREVAFGKYADCMFYSLGILYVLLTVICVRHAITQRNFQKYFDIINSSMDDYTMMLSGLPRSYTSEREMKTMVEKDLACKGEVLGVSIAYDLSDEAVRSSIWDLIEGRIVAEDVAFKANNAEMSQIGWGYDKILAKPRHLNWEEQKKTFLDLKKRGKLRGSGHAFVVFKRKSHLDNTRMKYKGMWASIKVTPINAVEVANLRNAMGSKCEGVPAALLEDISVLAARATGDADNDDVKSLQQPFARLNKAVLVGDEEELEAGTKIYHPDNIAIGKPIQCERLIKIMHDCLEPTSTLWWNFGIPGQARRKRKKNAVFVVSVTFLCIVAFVYLPLYYWLNNPWATASGSPGPVVSQVQGVLLGISGNILGFVNWQAVCNCGMFKKPTQDNSFIMFSTYLNFFNTIFFLGSGLYFWLLTGFNRVNMIGEGENDPTVVLAEWDLYNTFQATLIPGWLFSGVIIGRLMGWFVPLLQNFLISHAIFTRRCLPTGVKKVLSAIVPGNPEPDWLTARAAEHIFEPPEVALAWEYGQYIVTPTVCYFALFMMAPSSWKIFAALSIWMLFMFLLHRGPTLYISKKQMHSNATETLAERLWGIPLATILAAWGFWGVRSQKLGKPGFAASYWTMLFLFLLGLCVHLMLIASIEQKDSEAFDIVDSPIEETRTKLVYSWFNTNPVHVLKSCFCPEEIGQNSKEVLTKVPFEYGKEYLLQGQEVKKCGSSNSALSYLKRHF